MFLCEHCLLEQSADRQTAGENTSAENLQADSWSVCSLIRYSSQLIVEDQIKRLTPQMDNATIVQMMTPLMMTFHLQTCLSRQ